MTAKANTTTITTAAVAAVENMKNASYDRLAFASACNESQMLIDQNTQERNLGTQNQVPKEINTREEVSSRKRNLATFMNDDLESTISQEEYDHGFDSDDSGGIKTGRRPTAEDECDDDDEDPKVKRKIQNRAAQRAFRERKERYVKDLEKKMKYVQDSHIYSTTRLFNENQQLRSIIHTLELEINALKGTPLNMIADADVPLMQKKLPNQSWLANIGPSIPLPDINSFPPTPLAPLKIHSSRPETYNNDDSKPKKVAPIAMPEEKKRKKQAVQQKLITLSSFVSGNKIDLRHSKINKANDLPTKKSMKPSTENDNQQFTFAITTPATLRAYSNNNLARKNTQIEAVQLYPDHSHPANNMFDKKNQNNKQPDHMPDVTHSTTPILSPHYTSSVASSCSGNSCVSSPLGEEEDDEDIEHKPKTTPNNNHLLFENEGENEQAGLNDIFKQLFDPTGNLDLSIFNTHATNDWAMESVLEQY